ncbi:3,4-dihydroxy-2-butanone-4-phosphate synthase [Rhodococcus sp. NPDC057014]|uniref:3,4-dihydroxy-2-butanone-4-phosphate synthase n=1 Tax=Rhodococcus sp. NPDC057014 TaxID=3346000 RepID=UPI00363223EC
MTSTSTSVQRAVNAIAAGRLVIVTDSADRENEGDLVGAAAKVTSEQIAFLVRHTTGIVCAPMSANRADALNLPHMVVDNTDSHGTAFTVSVDYHDVGTGVSAADRARTLRALSDPTTRADQLRRPGHIFPLRARPGGVLERPGHTEAAIDLMTLAGEEPVGVIAEIVNDDGTMTRGRALQQFADEHNLPVVTIAELAQHRRSLGHERVPPSEAHIEFVASSTMPTRFGNFRAYAFRSPAGTEHLALVMGDVEAASNSHPGPLVRLHSECLTGDILGSLRCDCGAQLEAAFRAIAEEGCGAIVYLRGHEGRGIGLAPKIAAYALQDCGFDTVDANTALGFEVDARTFADGAGILKHLGVHRLRLITNNPVKIRELDDQDLTIVDCVSLPTTRSVHNIRYLRAKQQRMGHRIVLDDIEMCVDSSSDR